MNTNLHTYVDTNYIVHINITNIYFQNVIPFQKQKVLNKKNFEKSGFKHKERN